MSESVANYSPKRLYANLAGAILAGSFIAYFVLWRDSDGIYDYAELVKYIFLAVGSYMAAVVLVHVSGRWRFVRRKPSWLLAAILGSVILVSGILIVHIVVFIGSPGPWPNKPIVLLRIIIRAVTGALTFFMMFTVIYSFLALPIMAAVYYAGSLIQRVTNRFVQTRSR